MYMLQQINYKVYWYKSPLTVLIHTEKYIDSVNSYRKILNINDFQGLRVVFPYFSRTTFQAYNILSKSENATLQYFIFVTRYWKKSIF